MNLSMALAAIQLAQYVAFKEIQVKLHVLINLGHKSLNAVNNRHGLLTEARASIQPDE